MAKLKTQFNDLVQAPEAPAPEPFKVATWSDLTAPVILSDMTEFDIVYMEFWEDYYIWVPMTLTIQNAISKAFLVPYYYVYDGALAVEIAWDKASKSFTFFGYGPNPPSQAKIYYR